MPSTSMTTSRPKTAALDIRNLQVIYDGPAGGTVALNDMTLQVRQGEFLGLLGHNGCGKTTLLLSIVGLLRPNRGSVYVYGRQADSEAARAHVGLVTEGAGLYKEFSMREMLRFHAGLRDVNTTQVDRIIALFDLHRYVDARVRTLSTGWRKRLALACACLHEPPLLLLDEPFSGLDPVALDETKSLLRNLQQRLGTTVIVASHNLAEINTLCDRLAVMKSGKLLAFGTLDEFQNRFAVGDELIVRFDRRIPGTLVADPAVTKVENDTVHIDHEERLPELLRTAQRHGLRLHSVLRNTLTLPEIYKRLYEGGDSDAP